MIFCGNQKTDNYVIFDHLFRCAFIMNSHRLLTIWWIVVVSWVRIVLTYLTHILVLKSIECSFIWYHQGEENVTSWENWIFAVVVTKKMMNRINKTNILVFPTDPSFFKFLLSHILDIFLFFLFIFIFFFLFMILILLFILILIRTSMGPIPELLLMNILRVMKTASLREVLRGWW